MKGTAKARRSPCCWSMHMTSMLAQELIEELIDLHEKKADKE